MTDPIVPVPISHLPEQTGSSTGEGAQTALAAMIRKRKMAEHHADDEFVQAPSKQVPDA